MKKLVAMLGLLAAFHNCASSASAATLELPALNTLDMIASVVVSTEYDAAQEEWLISSKDTNGHIWQWYADDASWCAGDYVNLLIQDTNGTPYNIYDDEVVMVRYERFDLLTNS